jgi:two-component system, NarL family, nitrate/nitrite response regulator NarL
MLPHTETAKAPLAGFAGKSFAHSLSSRLPNLMITTDAVKSCTVATSQIRILIADDHEVMRLGIRNLLESQPTWTICGEAKDGREAVAKAIHLRPDVIIMDVTMPAMNGLEAANTIARSNLGIPVILFSLHLSEDLSNHLTGSNIRGAVGKSNAARDLVDAVEAVLNGGTFFPTRRAVTLCEASAQSR